MFKNHPSALYLLFFTEMWERFSYYGMRALLTIFLVTKVSDGGFGWSAEEAGQLYGFYTGFAYITPLLGGYLADKFLGNQYAVLIGASLMALGHGCLALNGIGFFYLGLGLLILGNGFFKPNISSMVGQLYKDDSPLKDAAYTIFYMGINIGAFFGTLLCGYLGEKIGWDYGFGAAGVFMVLGLLIFYFGRPMLGDIGTRKFLLVENAQKSQNQVLTVVEKDRISVLFILAVFCIVFWMAFEQAGSSMSIFALNYTERYISYFDFTVPASWFQSLNPLFVIVLAPIISNIWVWRANLGKNISNVHKFVIALVVLSLGFLVMVVAGLSISKSDTSAHVSMFFLTFSILLQTIAELCISPVGLSTVNKLAPQRLMSLMFGIWFFATSIGNYISGAFGGLIENMSKTYSMSVFFLFTCLIALLSALILGLFSKKILKMMHGIV